MTSTASPRQGWFGHPAPLARLFTVEMWERFGFYGMRALLTLYLTKHFLLGDRAATGLYGGYTALVYLTPVVGGMVADQILGSKRAVKFGALMMALGYFALGLGGQPSPSVAHIEGQAYAITRVAFHDGPTTAADATRQITIAGQALVIRASADGGTDLVARDGHVATHLPAGRYDETATPSPTRLALLLGALAMIAVGNGFFKPNISTMVGALYAQGDRRRDAGFTIFYMGINLGSILGQALCPLFADWLGWWAGFAIAGTAMLLSWLLISLAGDRLAGLGDTPPSAKPHAGWMTYAGAVLAVPLVYLLFANLMSASAPAPGSGFVGYLMALPVMGKLLIGMFVVGGMGILGWARRQGTPQEFQMMCAAMILMAFNIVFWTLFEQAGSSLTLFADRNTDRSVFGLFTLSAPQTQNFNSLAIVTLAPIMSILWGALAKRGLEPSIPVKFGVALMGVGAGFLLLVAGTGFADHSFRVGLGWLAGLYIIHSIAELCISPVGLSMITKLSIPRVVGLMMGMWLLSMAMGEYVAGMVAQVATVATVGGEVSNPAMSLATYAHVFSQIGWVAVVIGAVLLALARPLRRLMHGVT